MKKKIVAIVEARLSSKRLNGKVLKKINGKEIIKIILERLKFSKKIDHVVVATTLNRKDDRIVKTIKKKYNYFRGSERNVIKRVVDAADKFKAHIVVRLTGDNPLVDAKAIDYMLNYYLKNTKIDFLTNNHFGNLKKRKLALGLDINIINKDKLKFAQAQVKKLKNKKIFCEFPTLYFYTLGKKKFRIKNINMPKKFFIPKKYRLTIDTKDDYVFFLKLFSHFKSNNRYLNISDIKKILMKYPNLHKINNNVTQFQPKFR